MSRLKDSYAGCMECGGSMKMKSGGKWISKAIKNPGSFTKQAQSAGMSVSGFRNKVLANKGDYSSTTVKRANLAKTLSKMRKGEGGMDFKDPMAPDRLVNEVSSTNMTTNVAEQPIEKTTKQSSGLVRGGTEKVAAYQRMLRAKGFDIAVDGAWGKNTQAAYEKYMKSTGKSSKTNSSGSWYTPEQWDKSVGKTSTPVNTSETWWTPEQYDKTRGVPPKTTSGMPSVGRPKTYTGIKSRMMMGGSIPGVNGSVIGPAVPMSKTGQSFPRRNAGTSKLAKFKKK